MAAGRALVLTVSPNKHMDKLGRDVAKACLPFAAQTSDPSVPCPSWTPLPCLDPLPGRGRPYLAWPGSSELSWECLYIGEERSPVATVHLPSLDSGPPLPGPGLHFLSVDLATVHEPCLPRCLAWALWVLRVCFLCTLCSPLSIYRGLVKL